VLDDFRLRPAKSGVTPDLVQHLGGAAHDFVHRRIVGKFGVDARLRNGLSNMKTAGRGRFASARAKSCAKWLIASHPAICSPSKVTHRTRPQPGRDAVGSRTTADDGATSRKVSGRSRLLEISKERR
jgi:hypothetical protein